MAQADDNIITRQFSGALGKQLVFRRWEGKSVAAKNPGERSGEPTTSQLERQEKFLIASKYANAVVKSADQSMAIAYANKTRARQNVYSRALEDYLTSPKVNKIDTQNYHGTVGDKIKTLVFDDFDVSRVRVEIYAANGTLLESGDAVKVVSGIDWIYTATQANNLLAGTKIK